MRVAEDNRRDALLVSPSVMASTNAMLEQIDRKIDHVAREVEQLFKDYPWLRRQRELLISIPGIAKTTAARSLADMPNITKFRNVKAVGAFAGVSARHYQSGSVEYRSRLAKIRNTHLRRALYFPGRRKYGNTAQPKDSRFRYVLACARGKTKMTIVVAAVRKIITLADGATQIGSALRSGVSSHLRLGRTRHLVQKTGGDAIRRSRRARPAAPAGAKSA